MDITEIQSVRLDHGAPSVDDLRREHDAERPCKTHLDQHLQEEHDGFDGLAFDRYWPKAKLATELLAKIEHTLLNDGSDMERAVPYVGDVTNDHVADVCDLLDQLETIMAVRT